MLVYFDGYAVSEDDVVNLLGNRAFNYGDGLFETMIVTPDGIRFWERHVRRLLGGAEVLRIQQPTAQQWQEWREKAMFLAGIHFPDEKNVKVKIYLWRREGGLYTPTETAFHILIVALGVAFPPKEVLRAGVSRQAYVSYTSFSRFKTISALPYVMAGLEKKDRHLDDLVLLNPQGQVVECISSNIFWVRDEIIYTPSLETGCLEGVARAAMMEVLDIAGYEVKEVLADRMQLAEADSVFSSNVSGVSSIRNIEGIDYVPAVEVLEEIAFLFS